MKLPPELGPGKGTVGKLQKCMYGTRDAGAIWEWTYPQALLRMGFVQGASNLCCFRHPEWKLALPVHGDDFTCLGTDSNLNNYEAANKKGFEVGLRSRLGTDKPAAQEMQILNIIVRVTPRGLSCRAICTRRSKEEHPVSVVEACGRGGIVAEANHRSRNLNIEGLSAMDLRTNNANVEPLGFCTFSDRQQARKETKDKKPTRLIGSPPMRRVLSAYESELCSNDRSASAKVHH